MQEDQPNTIAVEQLQIGVYVYLDVGWMHHPFSFNNFKIKTQEQLDTICTLGLSKVRWDPARSDLKPLPCEPKGKHSAKEETTPVTALPAATSAAMARKHARSERLKHQREQLSKVQQAFTSASDTVRAINQNLFSKPEETVTQSAQLIGQMVDAFLEAPEVAIQVMSEKAGGEEIYLHAINVSVLAMMIGKEMGLPAELMRLLGIACLFHDIGLLEVPAKIVNKTETLTKPERDFYEEHCAYGRDIAKRVQLADAVQAAIYQHHECFDGSGYPARLKGEAINVLARIIHITNTYDELCNPVNIAQAMTPHEALSQMFAQQRARFDPKILQILIRCLGVYPPGTVVRLNNETVGLVISINAAKPLKPSVLIYDADVPKHEAIIVDLEHEPDLGVSAAIRPAQLPREIFDYLNPRKRVSYYFDPEAGTPPTGTRQ